MTARWDRLPATARTQRKPRRRSDPLEYRCGTCGAHTWGYSNAEQHADSHGGARIEIVIGETSEQSTPR